MEELVDEVWLVEISRYSAELSICAHALTFRCRTEATLCEQLGLFADLPTLLLSAAMNNI